MPAPATAAEEEEEAALLPPPPPPRSPPGRERGPLPGRESEGGGGLFPRANGAAAAAACQCSEDAADAMAALQGGGGGGRVVTAALDRVLRHANAAMAVLTRFLVCRGDHQESVLLLICFLAQRVATAYRQALCTCGGQASARNGSGVVVVQIPEIRVGSYRIVGEEGLLLMRQVVVVELRRFRRMVGRLREKMRDGGNSGCANAHSSLMQGFLQAELKSVLAQAG